MHIISQICISILINYYLTSFCNVCISRISILSLQHICLNKKVVHPQFKISKGVFQGDTFSSLLFLHGGIPNHYRSISNHPCHAWFFSSIGNGMKGEYTSWRQLATLQYCSKGYLESVDVTTIRWSSAKDNKRWYLLTKSMPSHHSVSNAKSFSKEHKMKGFTDDLTVISWMWSKRTSRSVGVCWSLL